MEKQCRKCMIKMPISCFGRHHKCKNGIRTVCRVCEKKYRENNRDHIRERYMKYALANREREIERHRVYHLNNKDIINKKHRDKYNSNKVDFLAKNKNRRRSAQLKYSFGITLHDYNEMFSNQEGLCMICGKHQSELNRALAVDHNHKTGKIRGLLCIRCNACIGQLNDSIPLLQKAIEYLKASE